jgi:uncharacterized protein
MIRMFLVFAVALTAASFMNLSHAEKPTQPSTSHAAQAQVITPALPPEMKQYWFVMLKKGPRRDQSAEDAQNVRAGHMANIKYSADRGVLQMAGPFMDDGDWRGIFILDVPDRAAAEAVCNDDPAVKSGRLTCEIHPWISQMGAMLK